MPRASHYKARRMRGQCVECAAPSPETARCERCCEERRQERKRARSRRTPRVVPARDGRVHPRRGPVAPDPPKLVPPSPELLLGFAALSPAQRDLLADCYRQRHLHAEDVDETDLDALRSARMVRRDVDPASGRKSKLWYAPTSAGDWCAAQVIAGGQEQDV